MPEGIRKVREPERIISYFKLEKCTLAAVAVSGILYNIGMTAGPWFEGKLAQYLCDIIGGKKQFKDMVLLAVLYVAAILFVEGMRYFKRLYVRRFANHINRDMKHVLYHNLVHRGKPELEMADVGSIMTRAIADIDTCVEGMRKFTTEIFDTGVVMISYLVMLCLYDWRLTMISVLFPPVAYWLAGRLKKRVAKSASAYKESAGALNGATLDRVTNAVLYRVYGQEKNRDAEYEEALSDYEKKAVSANLWENAMTPLYKMISMAGTIFIIWFGAKNVQGNGWAVWDIAAFSTFLACFTRLASKSSRAARLFNAVQKAQVSWQRIKEYMQEISEGEAEVLETAKKLSVADLHFSYPDGERILEGITFLAEPGEIIGVTGKVACGKSTLGKVFLCEYPYTGSIRLGDGELSEISAKGRKAVAYMGHEPELISGTIEENILLGESGDVDSYLRAVCMDKEVAQMPEGIHTVIGTGGVRLSGGQQARIALARTLFHKKPVLILDDPFSAVDQKTEFKIMQNLRKMAGECIVIILSHRLALFPEMDQVIWLEEGQGTVSDHKTLMEKNAAYARLYKTQTELGVHRQVKDRGLMQHTGEDGKEKNLCNHKLHGEIEKHLGKKNHILSVILRTVMNYRILTLGLMIAIAGTVAAGILPPLMLGNIVDRLVGSAGILPQMAVMYFLLLAAVGIFDAAKECLITVFGQKITHGLRSDMCRKLTGVKASYLIDNEPGVTASRFVNDVDTVESLFTSGIVSMAVDVCKVASILTVIFVKSQGLGFLMAVTAPFLFFITRLFQKRMLRVQYANRVAVGKVNNHVPETIKNIRMIHVFGKEKYMEGRYAGYIEQSYRAMEKSNFYDSIYSPILITIRTALIAGMMILSARGGDMQSFFGMSVGTAVAVIAYVGKVFEPLENIGMEIQNIQSAIAGVFRVNELLREPNRADLRLGEACFDKAAPAVEFRDVCFGYQEGQKVLNKYSFCVKQGESVTLTGRTGVGKSTVFKLLLGLYEPWSGSVCVKGVPAGRIAAEEKRRIFGYVEQNFRLIPGTVAEQVTLKDESVSRQDAERALKMVGMQDTVLALEKGYDTYCTPALFSQGQMQLLSIARAVAANPAILLLDEITANLDSATENRVLTALSEASRDRSVLSISHRIYESRGGRLICL